MNIIDCHSHWGTRRGYIFRTPDELARQAEIWKTEVRFFTEDEQATYFREHHVRAILDLSFTKFLPVEVGTPT